MTILYFKTLRSTVQVMSMADIILVPNAKTPVEMHVFHISSIRQSTSRDSGGGGGAGGLRSSDFP